MPKQVQHDNLSKVDHLNVILNLFQDLIGLAVMPDYFINTHLGCLHIGIAVKTDDSLAKEETVISKRWAFSRLIALSLLFVLMLSDGGKALSWEMAEGTVDQKVEHLRKISNLSIEEWRFKWGDFPGPEQPDFDDSDWKIVGTDFKWLPPDSKAWYRKWIEINYGNR